MKPLTDGSLKRRTLYFICAACFIFIAVFLAARLVDYYKGGIEADRPESLSGPAREETEAAASPPRASGQDRTKSVKPESTAEPEQPKQVLPKYLKLLELNNEVSGWIKIDGTRIDYPFAQHGDNDYYLHTDIENKGSKHGCIFIDYRNDRELKDLNTLVYGHNMKDGSMFKDLLKYRNRDFFYSHRTIHMDTLYEESDWQVFSVYVVDADKETIDIDYSVEGSFLKELNRFKERSMYKTDVELSGEDRIITLVTCSYETDNSRTIVHARLTGG